jgi:hypothetical protein
MTITRRDHGRGHSYLIDGNKVPGVTTILGAAMPKPALIEWAGKTTASYAVDHWTELAELTPSKQLDRLNKARFEERDTAARRGTEVHRLAEQLVKGEQVDVPDELAGHVQAYVDFLNTWEPAPVGVEMVVANRTIGYCGTVDLIASLRGVRWLLDVKTARSGIFPETALQCCAYARAETYLGIDEVALEPVELPMSGLGIERVGAIHVRADGWDLRPLEAGDEVWNYFRHLAWLYRRADDLQTWVGSALEPVRVATG